MGYICSCHALSFVRSLQCLRSSFTVRSGSAIPEPCCFLDSDRRTLAAHCFPALPASALRKAPFLPTESSASAYGKTRLCPTESSVSAYGKLRFCLRKAPPLPYGKLCFCPTESSVSAYGKLRFCLQESSASALRKAQFLCLRKAPPLPTKSSTLVSRCVLLPVINSLSATESSRLHCDRRI